MVVLYTLEEAPVFVHLKSTKLSFIADVKFKLKKQFKLIFCVSV